MRSLNPLCLAINFHGYVLKISLTLPRSVGDNHFVLAVNFPTSFEELVEMLIRKKDTRIIHNPIINGLHFEKIICEIAELEVLYILQRVKQ